MVVKWFRSLLSTSRKLIGNDHLGNKYYEVIKASGKIQRSVENLVKPEDFTSGEVPQEWEAWLRGRRHLPPTEQEIQENLQFTATVLKRAAIKKHEDDKKQEQAFADGLIARERSSTNTPAKIAKRASLPLNQSSRSSYQPDSLSPGSPKCNDAQFEPEAWVPGGSKK